MIRKIVEINQELCNGCGACANACHENAIVMIDGKATLIKDDYCDGFGDCLPACPTNAISIIEREAADYNEEEVKKRQALMKQLGGGCPGSMARSIVRKPAAENAGGCPGSRARSISKPAQNTAAGIAGAGSNTAADFGTAATPAAAPSANFAPAVSQLTSWPVQIKLVPVNAPYFDGANLLIAADCTAYAYASFHEEFLKNRIALIGCPKLDSVDYSEKLTEILKHNDIKSVTIVRMEVPCCGGLQNAAVSALRDCGKMIPWQVVTIGIDGQKRD